MSFIQKIGGLVFNNRIVRGVQDESDVHTSSVANQVYQEGVIRLSENNYVEALRLFKKSASLGHVSAKYNAALMLYNGLGDYTDFTLAKSLFEEAKILGHDKAFPYINFLNEVDKNMDISISDTDFNTDVVSMLCHLAFKKISISPDKQCGEFVYICHSYLLRIIQGNKLHAKKFIDNEMGNMFVDMNETTEKFLKYKGVYEDGFNERSYLNNNSFVSDYLDDVLFSRVISFSRYELDFSDLIYSRCCIVNEIMKKFPDCK